MAKHSDRPQPGSSKNRVVGRKEMREFVEENPGIKGAGKSLARWETTVESTRFLRFADVRATFATASKVESDTVFNVHGNEIRLVTRITYSAGVVHVRHVLTHKEYDKGRWKSPRVGRDGRSQERPR